MEKDGRKKLARGHSRSRLDPERANFIVAPAHGLEGGIVVAELTLAAHEVLPFEDGHTTLSVVLQGLGAARSKNTTDNVEVVSPVRQVYLKCQPPSKG